MDMFRTKEIADSSVMVDVTTTVSASISKV